MARLPRVLQKIFGSGAGVDEIGVFGSLKAGSPTTTTNPLTVQSLSNFLDGWFAAVLGSNSPAIEDRNALDFLWSRQLAYLFEAGVPEWDATTTYYTGDLVNSAGVLYVSLIDNNLNNAVTVVADWMRYEGRVQAKSASYNPAVTDRTINYTTAASSLTATIPTAVGVAGKRYTLSKVDSGAGKVTLATTSAQTIGPVGSGVIILGTLGDSITIESDGANWQIIVFNVFIGCKYTNSTTAIGTSVTTLVYPTKVYDPWGFYNPSTGIATVPFPGRYQIKACARTASVQSSSATANNDSYLTANKNGSVDSFLQEFTFQVATNSIPLTLCGSASIPCVATDTLNAAQLRASNLSSFSLEGSTETCWISIERLGN